MKHSSRYLISLTFITILALSIPFALILSQQSQRLTQYAQTMEQPTTVFSQEIQANPITTNQVVSEVRSDSTNPFHFLSTFVSLLWGLFDRS